MIAITPEEFDVLCQGLAGAHLFAQSICPVLKQRQTALNKEQRELVNTAPRAISDAFALIRALNDRQQGEAQSPANTPTLDLVDIDILLFRAELEHVSALLLPDLDHEMTCCIEELHLATNLTADGDQAEDKTPRLMAIAWEAGRRYGLLTANSIVECTVTEFSNGTRLALDTALNSALSLPGLLRKDRDREPLPFPPRNVELIDNYDDQFSDAKEVQ